jgi:AraC family transcriptional regulator
MKPKITDKKQITLAGMDFFGDPYEKAGGWSEQNAIGETWKRFTKFYDAKKGTIKHLASESGYELWIDFNEVKDTKNKYIFVGMEIKKIEDVPLELVTRILPATRYAVFTLKGPEIRTGLPRIWKEWLPEAGLTPAFNYLIEYYDHQRFKGMDNADSEIDFMVPIK